LGLWICVGVRLRVLHRVLKRGLSRYHAATVLFTFAIARALLGDRHAAWKIFGAH
jgi:hypothetical protein